MAVKGDGGVTLSYVCPHCHRFPLEDNMWWISSGSTERSSAASGVRLAAASTIGDIRTESLSYKTARTAEKQQCFERTLHRQKFVTI